MTDIALRHTTDGGEITYSAGQAEMSDGLETAVYLSWFGGNELDDATAATEHLQWWGNIEVDDEAEKQRSRLQALLRSSLPIPANLGRIEDAATADLAWLVSSGIAESAVASANMPGLNQIQIEATVVVNDEEFSYAFTEAWRAQST